MTATIHSIAIARSRAKARQAREWEELRQEMANLAKLVSVSAEALRRLDQAELPPSQREPTRDQDS
jgi:hypothetical protein